MKICYLAPANSIHSSKWIGFFANQGHDVHWITVHPPSEPVDERIKLHYIAINSRNPLGFLQLVLRFRKLLREIKPDILHVHSIALYGLGVFSGFKPIVSTAWGSDVLERKKTFWGRVYIRYVLKNSSMVTCDAYHMREELEAFGVAPNKIKIIFFGIDTQRFRPGLESGDIRARYGLQQGDLLVISLRSLYPVYDIQTLIRCVPLVLTRVPQAKFLIVGDGPEKDALWRLKKDMGLGEEVKLIGRIDNNELPNYLNSADVYVSTSLSDAGIAASTAEAMACGLPVVITRSGENEKWVENGESGYLVPVKDEKSLAEKIIYLFENKHLRGDLGRHGREVIVQRNNYVEEMIKVEALYKEVSQCEVA